MIKSEKEINNSLQLSFNIEHLIKKYGLIETIKLLEKNGVIVNMRGNRI